MFFRVKNVFENDEKFWRNKKFDVKNVLFYIKKFGIQNFGIKKVWCKNVFGLKIFFSVKMYFLA